MYGNDYGYKQVISYDVSPKMKQESTVLYSSITEDAHKYKRVGKSEKFIRKRNIGKKNCHICNGNDR